MGFCLKKYIPSPSPFLHHIQWIYLTLLSTTCVQIHQVTYVSFETISHFSQHKSSVSFQLNYDILSTKVAHERPNFQTFHFSKFPRHFSNKKSVFLQSSFFSVMRDNSSVLFRLKLHVLQAKVLHQSANSQTCHCLH